MKKAFAISFLLPLLLFTATAVFGHAGEVHSYMGTVTRVNTDGSFVLKTTKGKTITVLTSKETKYTHADQHSAKKRELVAGLRVVVKIAKDGKTATNIKMTIPTKEKK